MRTAVALPGNIVQDGTWSYSLVLVYISLITMAIPVCAGMWWILCQGKTKDGLYETTGYRFFAAATHNRNLGFYEIITFLSESEEILKTVKSKRKRLDINGLTQLYSALETKRDMEIAGDATVFQVAVLH